MTDEQKQRYKEARNTKKDKKRKNIRKNIEKMTNEHNYKR